MRTRKKLLRLQAEAFRRHGLTREQFLEITPAELNALNADALSERNQDKEIEDRRTARILAAIYNNNPNRKKGAKVHGEEDFLPKKATAKGTGNSADNIFAKVKWIHNRIHAAAKKKKTDGR